MAWGWVHFNFCVNYSFKGPLWLLTAKDAGVTSDHVNVPMVEYGHASTIEKMFMHWNLHSGHHTWISSQQVIHFHICSVFMPPDIYSEYMDPHNSFLWIKSEQTDWPRIHHRRLESPLDILLVVVALFPNQFCCQSSSAVRIRIPLLVSWRSICKSLPLRKSLTFTKVAGFNLYGGWKFQLSGPQCVGLSSKLLQMKRAGGSLNYSKWNKRLCHSTVRIRQERKGDTFQQEGVHPFYAYFSRLPDLWNMQNARI